MAEDASQQPSHEETNWGLFAHLAAFAGFIFPIGNIIGPLVIWLTQRDQSDFLAYHGKESLNFQISIVIYAIVSGFLVLAGIGILLLLIVGLLWVVFTIIGAVRASNGERYKYPFTIRLIQ